MQKVLLILGIVICALGVLSLLYAGLLWHVYKNTLDASAAFYHSRHDLAIKFFIGGIVAAVLGAAAIVFSRRV